MFSGHFLSVIYKNGCKILLEKTLLNIGKYLIMVLIEKLT